MNFDTYLRAKAQLFSLAQLEGLLTRELDAIAVVEREIEAFAGVKQE